MTQSQQNQNVKGRKNRDILMPPEERLLAQEMETPGAKVISQAKKTQQKRWKDRQIAKDNNGDKLFK